MNPQARIYVAGHRGLVGSALVRRLKTAGFTNLLLRTHAELELLDAALARNLPISLDLCLPVLRAWQR